MITSLIVVLVPGKGVIYTVSIGLIQGRRTSVYVALGFAAGIVPHLLATIFGLTAIMHTSALAFQALKYARVAYLFAMLLTLLGRTRRLLQWMGVCPKHPLLAW
ncbi:LysE family transporter [Rhodoferax sp.]|uniref:LysE family translocator n=1 Tax=Rhodoferax sp. TaxID=50421 RepID=UPI002846D228|nr:LysE family transporter [Rhodoferax sp.]MDR3368070.1 LysE family transporter [Rhodoferax sp.]